MKTTPVISLLLAAVLLCGCGTHYVTPAAGASLRTPEVGDLSKYYGRRPESPFPARISIARVQNRFTVVTVRDIETDEDFLKIQRLPLVSGIAAMGRLLLPDQVNSYDDLREPAAQLGTDLLLVYTVDTRFTVDGKLFGPLTPISLGLFPNRKAHVTATVSALLVDVRTGFIYGSAESSASEQQRASMWSTEMAIETARFRAEKQAFAEFAQDFGSFWAGIVQAHAAG